MWGKIAMYRTRLGLTEKELMRKPYISIIMELSDFPYYDYKAEGNEIRVKSKEQADEILDKYIK